MEELQKSQLENLAQDIREAQEKEREEKTIASEEAEEKRAIDKVDPFLESLEGI